MVLVSVVLVSTLVSVVLVSTLVSVVLVSVVLVSGIGFSGVGDNVTGGSRRVGRGVGQKRADAGEVPAGITGRVVGQKREDAGVVPAGITGRVVGRGVGDDSGVAPVAAKHCPRSLMSAIKSIWVSVTLT